MSPRVSVCRSRRQHGGHGSCQHLARKDLWGQMGSQADEVLSPAGQSPHQPMPREISVAWSSTLGVWGSAVSAVAWKLPLLYTESGILYPSGSFDNCLGICDAKCGICPGAYLWVVLLCRYSYSDHVCRYIKCVSLPDVSALT